MSLTIKYCKVCQDAGKSESEYRSHFTRESRDPNSKVCCPTLLALECRYCFKAGHTIKYCKILKDNEKNKKRWEQEAKKPVEKKNMNEKKQVAVTNKFTCLDSDDSENELEEHIESHKQITKEEFPQLCASNYKSNATSFGGFNYATAVATKYVAPLPASIPVRLYPLNKKKVSIAEMNWASMSSDEDEEEEEDYEMVQNAFNTYDEKECYMTTEEDW
uniref:Nanos-type domain-containing protein n=1 Tax=viral metagenome TaxID=1070528 RepID=A0A6C0IRN0_9ZZZZ